MDKYQALAELLQDEATAKEVFADSAAETARNLEAKGLTFTAEELMEISKNAYSSSNNTDEMSENDLENVSGGTSIRYLRVLVDIFRKAGWHFLRN